MIRALFALYRALIVVLVLLAIAFVALTAYALARGGAPASGAAKAPVSATAEKTGSSFFTGIGRVRAATDDLSPATVIVSIAFPYDPADAAFTEELASKTRSFRELAVDLFSSYSRGELEDLGETKLKTELMRSFNAVLRLGSIGELYFNDYLVVE